MIKDLSQALLYLSHFSGIVPLYFFIRGKFSFKLPILKLLGILILVSTVSDVISFMLGKTELANMAVFNIYFLAIFIILSFIYAHLLSEWSDGIFTICVSYSVFFLIKGFYIHDITVLQTYTTAVGCVFLIAYAFLYYHHLIKILPVTSPAKYLPFWINSAVAYYFCFNLLLFIFGTHMFFHFQEEGVLTLWAFHDVNNIIKNVLLAIGIYYGGNVEKYSVTHRY